MQLKTVRVPSISCGHCTATIERELKEVEGVVAVRGEVESKQVTVEWQAPASWQEICAVLTDIDHPPAEG